VNIAHLKRYRDIAKLMAKYGRSDVVRDGDDAPPADACELTNDLEALGPTFVKLGQLLSTRPDLIARPYTAALARLQDRCEPVPLSDVTRVIEHELEAPVTVAFSSFDPAPVASASLGQVHRARLVDGRVVAVKVQRPGIRGQVRDDLEALAEIAGFLDAHTEAGRRFGFADLFDQFRRSMTAELDYQQEAANLLSLREVVADNPYVIVPAPVEDHTTARVLTMDFVHGRKITDLTDDIRESIDGAALADGLFRCYLDQILGEGMFHADPHPGNVFLTEENKVGLVDLGMVARVPQRMQNALVRLMLAISEGRGEEVAEVAATMAQRLDVFDGDRFEREVTDLVARNSGLSVTELDAGEVMLELSRVSGDCGLRPPPEMAMLGKALLNLDQVAHALDPGFDPSAAIERHGSDILRSRFKASPGSVYNAVLETREFVEQLPGRVNKVMDAVADGRFELNVKAFDEAQLLQGLQKLANRVTMGLVLAALIVGAAMLMRVETSSKLLGYPSVAIICFLLAAAGGAWLLGSIVLADRAINVKAKRRRRSR
jgi:ubiquinone biosynthesis protein